MPEDSISELRNDIKEILAKIASIESSMAGNATLQDERNRVSRADLDALRTTNDRHFRDLEEKVESLRARFHQIVGIVIGSSVIISFFSDTVIKLILKP